MITCVPGSANMLPGPLMLGDLGLEETDGVLHQGVNVPSRTTGTGSTALRENLRSPSQSGPNGPATVRDDNAALHR